MKRQVDKTGGKLWFNENLIEGFQDQLYKAVESQYKPFGSCIISGCEVSGSNIAEGIVYLDSKIMPFADASGVTFPKYLKSQMTPVTAAYDDGHSDTTEEIYEAIISSTIPSGDYIIISAQGGKTFRQAFQDANNRMVSDAKINEWNASRGNAVSDVRDGVAADKNSLKKLYVWVMNTFIQISAVQVIRGQKIFNTGEFAPVVVDRTKLDGANTNIEFRQNGENSKFLGYGIDSSLRWGSNPDSGQNAIVAMLGDVNASKNAALDDIRDGVAIEKNTLKKLHDWAVGLFNTKVDKSVLSSNIASTSITNVATSKAVNDAKQSAMASASTDATTKADTAKSNAINDIRDGVAADKNTLKKLYAWVMNTFIQISAVQVIRGQKIFDTGEFAPIVVDRDRLRNCQEITYSNHLVI